jgi:hypothetical protein
MRSSRIAAGRPPGQHRAMPFRRDLRPSNVPALLAIAAIGCSPEATERVPRATPTSGDELSASADPDRTYALSLARRPRRGDRWRERSSTHGTTTERTSSGREVRERTYSIDAEIEVLEADAEHEVLALQIDEHVHRDWRSGDEDRGIESGTELVIERRTSVGRITRDGAPVSEGEAAMLDEVLELVMQGPGENDDVFYGTTEARAIGERWPMRRELLSAAADTTVDEAEMHFERIEPCEWGRCAVVTGRARMRSSSRTSTIEFFIRAPLDLSRPVLEERRRIVAFSADLRFESVYEYERTRTPID